MRAGKQRTLRIAAYRVMSQRILFEWQLLCGELERFAACHSKAGQLPVRVFFQRRLLRGIALTGRRASQAASGLKLLIINPNISTSVTALIESEARRAASPDTHITMATARTGVAYIETRFEALLGAHEAALIAAEHHAEHDAVIIAAHAGGMAVGNRAS